MSLITYTTYDSVRLVLGVDDLELSNEQLSMPYISHTVDKALASVSGVLSPDTEERTLSGQYAYLSGLGSLTSAQTLVKNEIEVYVTYLAAAEAGVSLQMQAPKTKSDGKALSTRFSSDATFLAGVERIYSKIAVAKAYLIEALGGTIENIPSIATSSPSEDLVTNS